jgi:FAD/FMN-containing dehydrogenase
MLTLDEARALQSSFQGHITSTHDAHVEFRGEPPVLIPEMSSDVGAALRLARAANRVVFVQSGRSVSAADVSPPVAGAPHSAIVSMEAFGGIDVGDQQVAAGAAATTGQLADALAGKSVFLPLDDNPTRSVASAVLRTAASPFPRSGAALGSLRSTVTEAEVVPIEGDDAGIARKLRGGPLQDLLAGRSRAVITRLVFDGASKPTEAERWTQIWSTPYEPEAFAALCDALLVADGGSSDLPSGVDLTVRATSVAYAMNLIVIRTTGRGDADAKAAEGLVQAALSGAKARAWDVERAVGPGDSIEAWTASGSNDAAYDEVIKRFGSNIAPRPFVAFRRELLDAVGFALGVDATTGAEHAPGVRAWVELQLTAGGDVVARAAMSDADAQPSVAHEAERRLGAAITADPLSPTASVWPELESTPGFDLVTTNRPGSATIPGFRGEVLDASSPGYRDARDQYAVSSYPPDVVRARMTPKLIAKPIDAGDVAIAVRYAADNQLKIGARSGGHQYCGLSSGGQDTLLLDMKLFHDVVFSPASGTPTHVTVGPGVTLKDVSKLLRKKGVVIPHGECPLVRLGGHVQTGGIGHQLRSLGATLDWVRSFKMVTRDPTSTGAGTYVERTFTRPQPGAGGGATAPTDDDVFRAVLGGGPSSWGVLTEITFELVPDSRFPTSVGLTHNYLFGLHENGFRAAMDQLRLWAERQAAGALPDGIDLFLSFVSGDFPRPAAVLLETMSTSEAGQPEITKVADVVRDAMPPLVVVVRPINGRAKVSFIADAGVRPIGLFGLPANGREFDLPYKKSLHITKTPFTASFLDGFVNLVAEAEQSGLKVVVQTVLGGGAFSAGGQTQTTHMQRRDALVQLVFDLFYGPKQEPQAKALQLRMKSLLAEFSRGEDVRMLWGTFEDAGAAQLDMSERQVQGFYYDSPAEYARLQQIKQYTDPQDLFHTSFTVERPS